MSNEKDTIDSILNQLADGDAIYYVEGTLTKLYKATTTQYGALQNGELTDDQGDAIKVTFADCEQNMSARNQRITLESVETQAHGWTGVKVKDDGNYPRAIWVTPSARITYSGGSGGGNQQRQQPQGQQPQQGRQQRQPQSQARGGGGNRQQPAQRPQQQPKQQSSQQPSRSNQAENQFETVQRLASCYFYVHNLVNEKAAFDSGITPIQRADLVTRMAATIFVDVAKAGIAANWNPNFKTRRFPAPPSDPMNWKECYIDKEGSALDGKRLSEISDDELRKLHDFFDEKKSNTPLAECVYQAAVERKIYVQESPEDVALDPDQDIPF